MLLPRGQRNGIQPHISIIFVRGEQATKARSDSSHTFHAILAVDVHEAERNLEILRPALTGL